MAKTDVVEKEGKIRIERRCKLLYVSDRIILQIIKGFFDYEFLNLPDFSDCLPEDVQVMAVQYDLSRASFTIVIYSSTFDIVADGATIPELEVDVDYRYRIIRLPKDEK